MTCHPLYTTFAASDPFVSFHPEVQPPALGELGAGRAVPPAEPVVGVCPGQPQQAQRLSPPRAARRFTRRLPGLERLCPQRGVPDAHDVPQAAVPDAHHFQLWRL